MLSTWNKKWGSKYGRYSGKQEFKSRRYLFVNGNELWIIQRIFDRTHFLHSNFKEWIKFLLQFKTKTKLFNWFEFSKARIILKTWLGIIHRFQMAYLCPFRIRTCCLLICITNSYIFFVHKIWFVVDFNTKCHKTVINHSSKNLL